MIWKNISFKGLAILVLVLIILLLIVLLIFIKVPTDYINAAVAILLAIIAPLAAIIFSPLYTIIKNSIDALCIKQSVYRICIFGRSGTGKTTLMENGFILDPNQIIKSTPHFDFYEFKVQLRTRSPIREVAVADYKGQNPSQVILYGSSKFFGNDNNRLVNAVLFMVDLLPKKVDEEGNLMSDELLLKWLKSEDIMKKIDARIQQNYDYISESTLELFFSKMYSKRNFKSVRLLINKVDLINKLISEGYITLSNFQTVKEYVEYKF